jgi:hypothetical protein
MITAHMKKMTQSNFTRVYHGDRVIACGEKDIQLSKSKRSCLCVTWGLGSCTDLISEH